MVRLWRTLPASVDGGRHLEPLARPPLVDLPSSLTVCERLGTVRRGVVGDEGRLDVLRIGVRGRLPSHEQVRAVAQLPDIASSPVSNRFALAVAAVLVQPLAKPPPAVHSTTGFPDVENGCLINPRMLKLIGRHSRVLALEASGDAVRLESWPISGGPEDDVHASLHRHASLPEFEKSFEALEASRLQTLARPFHEFILPVGGWQQP